jgi:hypothetical protein
VYHARRLLQTDPVIGHWCVEGRVPPPAELLRLAGELGCDPRWLATGQVSPAGEAAAALLVLSGFVDDDDEVAVAIARLTPQPPAPPNRLSIGTSCRYCGCVWADRECTICTACLEVAP